MTPTTWVNQATTSTSMAMRMTSTAIILKNKANTSKTKEGVATHAAILVIPAVDASMHAANAVVPTLWTLNDRDSSETRYINRDKNMVKLNLVSSKKKRWKNQRNL